MFKVTGVVDREGNVAALAVPIRTVESAIATSKAAERYFNYTILAQTLLEEFNEIF
jgi:hypothetical protein